MPDSRQVTNVKERQYANSKALWAAILAVDAILLAAQNILDAESPLSTVLFNALIVASAFLILTNFYHFRKVQNDKLEYKASNDPKQHYDYHTSIMRFSIKTESAALVFILAAIVVWIQDWI